MRAILLLAISGCVFTHGSAPQQRDDAGTTDTPETQQIDASLDAPPDAAPTVIPSCKVGAQSATGTDRGRVGGDNGGDNFEPLACTNPQDRIVGVELRMSDQNTIYGQRSAHAFRIACAPVTVTANGATTGTPYTVELLALGTFDWSPSSYTGITQCDPGSVVTGISAHTAQGQNLFLDVSIRCTPITVAGVLGTPHDVNYVAGSLDETQNNDVQNCGAGEMIVRLANRTGAGIDSLNLLCTTPTCIP